MWSDIVKHGSLDTSPWMRWDEVTANPGALPDNNAQPDMGDAHPSVAKALIRVLDAGSGSHQFATWDGYSGGDGKSVIEFSPVGRGMVCTRPTGR